MNRLLRFILDHTIVVSNVSYPLAALLIVQEPVFTLLMLALGSASAFWHFARTRFGADLDVGMMFVILLFLAGTLVGLPPMLSVLPAVPGAYALRKKLPKLRMEIKVGALTAPLLIGGFLLGGSNLVVTTVVLLVALAVRKYVDHALWHPLSAIGLSLLAGALMAL